MTETLDRLEGRLAWVRRATVIFAAVVAAVVVVLGARLALEAGGLLSARHSLGGQAARQERLRSAVARLPRSSATATGARLAPDATFLALAEHVSALAEKTGSGVRVLKRVETDRLDNELRAPAGEAEVVAQLHLDTGYRSGLEFLRALDGLPLPVVPLEVDMESTAPGAKEPRLLVRLQLLAYGMTPKRGG